MRSPDAQPQLAAGSAAHASVVSQEEEEEKEKAVVVEVGVVDPRQSLLLESNGKLFRNVWFLKRVIVISTGRHG